MDSDRLNLDLLARETFDLCGHLKGRLNNANFDRDYRKYTDPNFTEAVQAELDFNDFSVTEQVTQQQLEVLAPVVQTLPEGPGLLYRIEKTTGTFCVRGVACPDLQYFWEELLKGETELVQALKLEPDQLDEASLQNELYYFTTEHFAQAEVIYDQLINRRFPLKEDLLCNLSDPGFSWWLDHSNPKRITIYFKSHGIDRAERFVQLGPLGDPMLAKSRFQQLYLWLKVVMPIAEFSCTDKHLQLAVSDGNHPLFKQLLELFTIGEFHIDPARFQQQGRASTLYYYLNELAALRAFWRKIESKLS